MYIVVNAVKIYSPFCITLVLALGKTVISKILCRNTVIIEPSDKKTTLSYFVPKSRKCASKLTCARKCLAI